MNILSPAKFTWAIVFATVVWANIGGAIAGDVSSLAEIVDTDALSGVDNLAGAVGGGRVVSDLARISSSSRLIDGNPDDGWWSKETFDPAKPVDIVIRLGGDGDTSIDRVLIQPKHFQGGRRPRELELAVSTTQAEDGFQSVGRFTLQRKHAFQQMKFAPRKAKFIKITILSLYLPGKPSVAEVMALAHRPGSNAGDNTTTAAAVPKKIPEPARQEPATSPAESTIAILDQKILDRETHRDLAQPGLGGVITMSPGEKGALPKDVEISFFDGRTAVIDGVVLQSRDSQWVSKAHAIELWAVVAGNQTLVGKYLLHNSPMPQSLAFAPIAARSLRVRVLTAFPYSFEPNTFDFDRVMVLEAPGESILDGAIALLDQEAPERESLRDLAQAALGGVTTLLPGEKGVLPRDVEISFFDGREAVIDGVVLQSRDSQWVSKAHAIELWAVVAGNDEIVGKYLLRNSAIPQNLAFAPVAAQSLRIRVLTAFPYNFEPNTFDFDRVMVLEADRNERPSLRDSVVAKAFDPKSVAPRMNIAHKVLGGTVESATSEHKDDNPKEFLIDGGKVNNLPWRAAQLDELQKIVFSFQKRRSAWIDTVVVESDRLTPTATSRVNVFEIQTSTAEYPDEGSFTPVARYLLPATGSAHAVRFEPVEARFLRLVILSTTGKGPPALAEVMVFEAPGRPSILKDAEVDIANAFIGGHIARFTSQDNFASSIIDGTADHEQPGWTSRNWGKRKATDTQELVIAFNSSREALIERIVVDPSFPGADLNTPSEFKVLVSTRNALDGFEEAAVGRSQPLKPEKGSWPLSLVFQKPTKARYVMLRLTANYGGGRFALGDVRIIESNKPGYVSVAAVGKRSEDLAVVERAAESACSGVCEVEPNDAPEQATPLIPEQATGGRIDPSETDYFTIEPDDHAVDILNVNFQESPYVKTTITLENQNGRALESIKPANSADSKVAFSIAVPAGKYRLRLTEPLPRIALVYDNSGSMDGSRARLKAALKEYVRGVDEDDEVLLFGFGTEVEQVYLYTAGEEVSAECRKGKSPHKACILTRLIDSSVKNAGGTSLFDAILAATTALGPTGNRALLLMTDGHDTKSESWPPEVWEALRANRVRIYTIGLGHELRQFYGESAKNIGSSGEDFLRNIALATGGRYYFAPTADRLAGIYRAIRDELSRGSRYRLTAGFSRGVGSLRIEEAGGRVVTSNAAAINLVFDLSGSMGWCLSKDVRCPERDNRLTAAKKALTETIQEIPDGVLLGLRVFGFKPSDPAASKDARCRATTARVAKIAKMNASYRTTLIDWINKSRHGGRRSQTAIGYSLSQVAGDFPSGTIDRKVILVTDGDDDCHGKNSRFYPASVVTELRRSGFDVRIDVVGFAVENERVVDRLRELARLGDGVFYMAKDSAKLRRALRRSFNASFEVRDRAGTIVTSGRVGGPVVKLPTGTFNAIVRTTGGDVTIAGVEIRDRKTTILRLDKEGSRTAVGPPEFVTYVQPGSDDYRERSADGAELSPLSLNEGSASVPVDNPLRRLLEASVADLTAKRRPSEGRSSANVPVEDPIRRLLDVAEGHLAGNRLTTPRRGNANEIYQEILRLDPGNEAARNGIRRIADRYLDLSKRASRRGDPDKATGFLEKGLKLSPRHAGLMVQQVAMLKARADRVRREQERIERLRKERISRRLEDERNELLNAVDVALLGPGVSRSVKDRLTKRDLNQIVQTYMAAFQIAKDGETFRWDNSETGHFGLVILKGRYAGDDGIPCRIYQQIFNINGREETVARSVACQAEPNIWIRR